MTWIGVSRTKPVVQRYRTIDGLYALRITCWHGASGDLAYPDRVTVENWHAYASLSPCRYVQACPKFEWWQRSQARHAKALTQPYQDLVPPHRRSVKTEKAARAGRKKR